MCSSDLEEDGDDQFDIDESDDEDELEDALHVVTSLEDHDLYHDDDDDDGHGDGNGNEEVLKRTIAQEATADEIMALLAMSLIELQAHLDFDEAREAKANGEQLETRWNDQGCIETVRNLVLVVEAMLMHGVLLKRRKQTVAIPPPGLMDESDAFAIDADPVPEVFCKEYRTLIAMLMEMTSDLEAFENEIKNVDMNVDVDKMYDKDSGDLRSISRPKAGDLSTLRTLIAAWLHTGVGCIPHTTSLDAFWRFYFRSFLSQRCLYPQARRHRWLSSPIARTSEC